MKGRGDAGTGATRRKKKIDGKLILLSPRRPGPRVSASLPLSFMSRRRFYAPRENFAADGKQVTLAQEEARHMRDVLRLRRGDEVFVFDGEGREFVCEIEEIRSLDALLFVKDEVKPSCPESPLDLTLAVALLKGEKFDLVVQKATELGATRIVPVITKLADVRVRDEKDAERRVARWQRIMMEAAKQCGRARVPEIFGLTDFTSLVRGSTSNVDEKFLIFSERGGQGLNEIIPVIKRPESLTALVGSEGGWTDEEIEMARDAGWLVVTLGGRTLRAETAAIVVAALLQHLLGDLK